MDVDLRLTDDTGQLAMCAHTGHPSRRDCRGKRPTTSLHVHTHMNKSTGTHTLNSLKTFTLPLDPSIPHATLQAIPELVLRLLEGLLVYWVERDDGGSKV